MKRIYLFGSVPFDPISKNQLLKEILSWAKERRKKLVLNMNAYGVVTFLKKPKYAKTIRSADLIYPDGWGPVWASHYFDAHLPERVNVGDFINDLLKGLDKQKLGLFLLGCDKKTLEKMLTVVKNKYPKIRICGGYQGFFLREKEPQIIAEIRRTHPDLVLVGMGVPAQEYFLGRNWKDLSPAVYMGVGGVFYYIAGLKARAPKWMRESGFEWLYRLFQEPGRLGRRYTLDNLYFVSIFARSLLKKWFT